MIPQPYVTYLFDTSFGFFQPHFDGDACSMSYCDEAVQLRDTS